MTEITTQAVTDQEECPSILGRAAGGIRKGAADAGKAVGNAFTTLGQLGSKAVYGACYGVSYGFTFAALSVSKVLPETMLRGFREGAEAAEAILECKTPDLGEESEQPA